jgi:two-component system, OmpR family, phosphate regulon sensor histidine kinase PhoR
LETGDIKMHFEQIDLRKLCEEVVEQFEEKAEKKKIQVKVLADQHSKVLVFADWKRISQVVTNLVSNAIKYSADDSEVTITFDIGKKNVTTFISDSGEGIPTSHLARIFERFYRVDKSRSREKGGTGLGLAIVKHILEGHNTKAEVQSTVGRGSVFSFKLARVKGEEGELNEDK